MRSPSVLSGLAALAISAAVPATASSSVLSLKEMREAGVVRQEWDTSCGAAALATVMTYGFDDPVSEHDVALGLLRQTEPLKVRHRGGFSLLDMKRFAETRGYRALAFSDMAFADIRHLNNPIVPLNIRGYNHYVVVKGVDSRGAVRIGDPAYGNRTLSRAAFDKAWIGGIAFVLTRAG